MKFPNLVVLLKTLSVRLSVIITIIINGLLTTKESQLKKNTL